MKFKYSLRQYIEYSDIAFLNPRKSLCALWLIICLFLISCGSSDNEGQISTTNNQQAQQTSLPKVLVDALWLNQHLNDTNVRILDLSKERATYHRGHIPNALYVDWLKDIIDPEMAEQYMVLAKEEMEELMGKLGITKETTVILYDDMTSRLSTRMFWTMRYYNHNDIRILNGGREAWQKAGLEFSTTINAIVPTEYMIDQVNDELITDKSFIETRLDDINNFTLVDGRPFEQYTGQMSGVVFHTGIAHKRKGHIFGAQSVPWTKNFNEDGTFKSLDELRLLYEPHHVTKNKTIVTYCNEGLHAAPPWFVLKELLDYPDVRLYDASMAEWANDDNTRMIEGLRCM